MAAAAVGNETPSRGQWPRSTPHTTVMGHGTRVLQSARAEGGPRQSSTHGHGPPHMRQQRVRVSQHRRTSQHSFCRGQVVLCCTGRAPVQHAHRNIPRWPATPCDMRACCFKLLIDTCLRLSTSFAGFRSARGQAPMSATVAPSCTRKRERMAPFGF